MSNIIYWIAASIVIAALVWTILGVVLTIINTILGAKADRLTRETFDIEARIKDMLARGQYKVLDVGLHETDDDDLEEPGNVVYFPIGISGSGKDYTYENLFPWCVKICPDDIRRVFGDVTDQSRNAEVFDLTHFMLKREMSYGQRDIYLSETHLWLPGIQEELEMVLSYGYEPVFVLLDTASRDWELCRDRVKWALQNGEDRSATADVILDDGTPLIKNMSDRYKTLVESEDFKQLTKGYRVKKL